MDRADFDRLRRRLVENPHDEDALTAAHALGQEDPEAYANFFEHLARDAGDAGYASHWLSEAAQVWSFALADQHRAARLLMQAVDQDPTHKIAADRLAHLYRDRDDQKALLALLDRRAKALLALGEPDAETRIELASMFEEMGKTWNGPPFSQPRKAIDCFRRALESDPESAFAIYSLREVLKSVGDFADAIPLYDAELALESETPRKVALLRDKAQTYRDLGQLPMVTRTLGEARAIDDADPLVHQEFASSVLDRVQAGEIVPSRESREASRLLVSLAEAYGGDHALAYSTAALDIEPGNDRALQLAAYHARALDRDAEIPPRYEAYLVANPTGSSAADARHALASRYEGMGRFDEAVRVLEPLKAAGDPIASAKVLELVPLAAQSSHQAIESALPPSSRGANSQTTAENRADPPSVIDLPKRPVHSPERLQGMLDAAHMLVQKGKRAEALAKYKEILDGDPAQSEALGWVEDYLRQKRDYAGLKDVLFAAVRAPTSRESVDSKKERLREIAGLSEVHLRDTEGAVAAWKQLMSTDRSDESARSALMRLLEKSQRWDELATLLEQEAAIEADIPRKIAVEKRLAKLQEERRNDFYLAGVAWSRIAQLAPDDALAVQSALRLFERADRLDAAAHLLVDAAPRVEDPVARGPLLERLGELAERGGDLATAAQAYADAADALKNPKLWENAERLYIGLDAWERAANSAVQRGLSSPDARTHAQFLFRASEHFARAQDSTSALARLEDATDLDPITDDYANALTTRYRQTGDYAKLSQFLAARADKVTEKTKRTELLREAAQISTRELKDRATARDIWVRVLEGGDDREALEALVDDALDRSDHAEAATLLRRLRVHSQDRSEKARVALREAELLATVGDIETALATYEEILSDLDATCREALSAIAEIEESRKNYTAAAVAIERELKLVSEAGERGALAKHLGRLYELTGDMRAEIRALDIARKSDPEDFDLLLRLVTLSEGCEDWSRVSELVVERIEVEADEDEITTLTLRLATILHERLDRGDEALAVLAERADDGDTRIREAYIELADRLGWKAIVGSKLVEWWFDAKHGPDRLAALRRAFARFIEVGRDKDALHVAIELFRVKAGDLELATKVEELAIQAGDQDALMISHELMVRDATAASRAEELVRQAEVRAGIGMSRSDALMHGEVGLTFIPPSEAEPLLVRLAEIVPKREDVVDLYERQIARAKKPEDRVSALARAAEVAADRGQTDRARGFFELALVGALHEETLVSLENSATVGDLAHGGDRLRRSLAWAMANGGHAARDGGRTRSLLLRRAANFAYRELQDTDLAFQWMGAALVAHVDNPVLDAIEALGREVRDEARVEASLTGALADVFDGPLVRLLLHRRARLRRDRLNDHAGAAVDLKKLHDLSPGDTGIMTELATLLMDLGDFRVLVQIYEGQILRGRDPDTRAELARKVARLWEEQLADARETTEAWRRVLRIKANDPEATAGIERARSGNLRRPEADPKSLRESYAPPESKHPPQSRRRESWQGPAASQSKIPGAPPRGPLPSVPPPIIEEASVVSSTSAKMPSAPRFAVAAPSASVSDLSDDTGITKTLNRPSHPSMPIHSASPATTVDPERMERDFDITSPHDVEMPPRTMRMANRPSGAPYRPSESPATRPARSLMNRLANDETEARVVETDNELTSDGIDDRVSPAARSVMPHAPPVDSFEESGPTSVVTSPHMNPVWNPNRGAAALPKEHAPLPPLAPQEESSDNDRTAAMKMPAASSIDLDVSDFEEVPEGEERTPQQPSSDHVIIADDLAEDVPEDSEPSGRKLP